MANIKKCTTDRSFWRGYNYYEEGAVISVKDLGNGLFECLVEGSQEEPYKVILDPEKPRKSTCTCPYCEGHPNRVCKHQVASYFAVHPEEFNNVKEQVKAHEKKRHEAMERLQKEYEEFELKQTLIVKEYVDSFSEEEVRQMLLERILKDRLYDGKRNIEDEYAYNYDPDFEDDDSFDEFLDSDYDF